ncbi:MAG: two-component system response regulator [Deltaproteobacteria bacterium]|nr:two-component system response regulator [Deltaproteobacteria bacterium]
MRKALTATEPPPESKTPIILVVDDEEVNLRLIDALLRPQGYKVITARDGEQALSKVKETPPDVILLDIMMPKMNGFEVAERLRQDSETRLIPIVMVTALQDVEDRVRALEAGAEDFLSKPVARTELRARIRSLLKVKAYNDHMRNYQLVLEAEVSKRTAEIQRVMAKSVRASLETIHRLSRAAEYKDEDTGAHILRMSNYSALIARKIGLNETTVQRILYAAPMHDVGKIGIPDHILLKPGPLSPDEWVIMKQHSIIGANILEESEEGYITLGEVIARTHHEKWNGTGYPRGLAGKKIPLVGRIVAVADVFDALMSKRPYKEPFPLEKSLSIMKDGRGSHFDPMVVDAFFEALDQILAIREQYQDEHQSRLVQMMNLAGR